MIPFFQIVTTISIGLMIGAEFAVWAFINPIIWKLEEPSRMEAIRYFARRLGKVMPFWYVFNLILLVSEAFLLRREIRSTLIGAAAGIWAVVIILTLMFLVPINNRLASWNSHQPVDQAQREHKRWDAMHRARVVALETAMVLFLLAVNS
jgi:uncharacterized membrane protein